ncbi:MAG: polyamine ABC transporter ATP-binding protein [Neisseriaceae bacterium]|nr:MAG: polyamine ABC transporter ATP-binding protein [Neisseriaceae bacterium]
MVNNDVDKVLEKDTPFLKIQNVTKTFGDYYAVDDVSQDIYQGEIFALLGSSGGGKSTLLRILAGIEKPTSGRIILDGKDITKDKPYDRPINMMFQSYALFPHMTVEQNVAFGLKQDKISKDEIEERTAQMLKLVQMSKFANRKPNQLSGGQQQRVALARSLVKKPKVLLLDEPLGALDKNLRKQTQLELVNTIEMVAVTCVMITHDQEEAMTMATRIAVMSDGKFQQVGKPFDIYKYPNSRFTAQFLGDTNILHGFVVSDQSDSMEIISEHLNNHFYLSYSLGGPDNMEVWVSIRPEDVNMYKTKPSHLTDYNWASGVVEEIAFLGSVAVYYVRLDSGFIMRSTIPSSRWYLADERPPTWGDTVYIAWHSDQPVALTR